VVRCGDHGPTLRRRARAYWDQRELIDAGRVAAKLQAAGVEFAVAAGTPSELALELANASGGRVIPLFSPYIHELGRRDWYLDPRVVARAEAGLSAGDYHGIGEIHFMIGFRPRFDNDVFRQLMALAGEYRVPALIHIDSSNETAFLSVCRAYPALDILFAHAGGNLHARHASVDWRVKTAACCPTGASWCSNTRTASSPAPTRYGGSRAPNPGISPTTAGIISSS
jgi:hypothetical protein